MAKTKRRHRHNKVRRSRTKSRRGGVPVTIKGTTYGDNQSVPFTLRGLLPYSRTSAQAGFLPSASSVRSVIYKDKKEKTMEEKAIKRLHKRRNEEINMVKNNSELSEDEKNNQIEEISAKFNAAIQDTINTYARMNREAATRSNYRPIQRAKEFWYDRKQSVKRGISSMAQRLSGAMDM